MRDGEPDRGTVLTLMYLNVLDILAHDVLAITTAGLEGLKERLA